MPIPNATPLDAASFALLYERTHCTIFRFIYSLQGGTIQEAEDSTAETYLRAWKARHRFKGDADMALRWLFRISRNLVIDLHRRHKVRGPVESIEDPVNYFSLNDTMASPEQVTSAREQFRILWQLLHDLTLEKRELILLRYMFGWSIKEIALYQNELENTISVRLRRVLESLRSQWPESE